MSTEKRERFKDRVREIYNKNKLEEEKEKKPFFLIKIIGVIGSFIFERDNVVKKEEKKYKVDDTKALDTSIKKNITHNYYKVNILNNDTPKKEKDFISKTKRNSIKRVIPELVVRKKKKNIVDNSSDKNIDTKYKGIDKAPIENNIVLAEDINTLEKKKDKLEEIKRKFVVAFDKLEILESELYVLKEVTDDVYLTKKAEEHMKKIKKIIEEIDKLKEKFEYLKKDYDFEYIFKMDKNNVITHEIIELNSIFADEESMPLTKEYKLLDLYNDLYKKVEKVETEVAVMEKDKEKQIEELKKRDIDFDELKKEVFKRENKNKEYDSFIEKENKILEDLNKNVSKIDSKKVEEYYLKGYNELLRNYFKLSLLFLTSPLKGLIPSIARETIVTRKAIRDIKDNMTMEKKIRTVYSAMDYSSVISDAIYDLKYTNGIIDKTLEEITSLKEGYKEKFMDYQDDMPEYADTIKKLNDIEKRVLSNKRKVELMKEKMYIKEKENIKKLILVRDLNSKQ